MRRFLLSLFVALSAVLAVPQIAEAHVERPSYWPDPNPDCAVSPCAGGEIPVARSLASALDASLPGDTRVVCKPNSKQLLEQSITAALANGYDVRPTDHRAFTQAEANSLRSINNQLFAKCAYDEIQPAVTASGNNDRVVVMPGIYTEPTSAAQPTYDPACAAYKTHSDSGDPGALSHEYQLRCPNDANLVAVIGRGIGSGTDPDPALEDRHGIPNAGACIRCNLQLEGSGVSSDDVVVEAGDPAAGDGGPSAAGHRKDVGIFLDRADGFVLRKMNIRHAREHGIYVLETDGYLLDQFKTFYNGAYGVLTFVGDHGVMQDCEATGSGDSGLYPGSGAPTLTNRDKSFYPEARISQRLTRCDSHHNTGGFSGTNSHGTRIDHNNFYDNALGYTTDVFTAAGHPGFPQQGNVIEDNNFYSNNFNPFSPGSEVQPFIGAPVGTGLWLAGGNENVVRNNNFWDNWRRGLMLFAVPDATVCGPILGTTTTPIPGCTLTGISTSYNNKFYGNTMGVAPDGSAKPNGVDFWWDAFPTNTGNCWWSNKAASGKSVTTNGLQLPNCLNGGLPALSIGLGNVPAEAELVACLAGYTISGYPNGESSICSWAKTPTKPGTGIDVSLGRTQQQVLKEYCDQNATSRTCSPYLAGIVDLSFLTKILAPLMPAPAVGAAPVVDQRLSAYTCTWWRQADPSHKLGLVKRLRHFAGGAVEGDTLVGYGNVLPNGGAMQLLDDRCSTSYAGPLALYKIYGAAAAFGAANG
ncbi:right-handed parallel beta-helix repeat-containing protein [Marmoricola sp. RAF53]|uniref:right-handed parallel beta-helix repeat-containing protein n=1 Tax=Marmoricola sp. RAF53 TaxID=3233059 RepID=UPI003F9C751E